MKQTKKGFVLMVVFVLFLLLNIFAIMHSYKMTHFTDSGNKPPKPESLTGLDKFKILLTGIEVPKPPNERVPLSIKYEVLKFSGYNNTVLEAWLLKGLKKDEIVLMFHGYAESKTQLIPEALKFVSKGYNVMLVDFYGSGGSAGNSTSVGYHEADDVKAAYKKAVELGYKNIYLFAVSMGSAASIMAINVYGIKPKSMIIESPFAGLLDTVRRRFDLMNIPSWPLAEIFVFWGSVVSGYNGFTFNPAELAKNVNVPVLILHGSLDKRVSITQAELLNDSLKGKKKLVIFSKAGHLSFMQSDEGLWDKEVFEWIGSK
ncbi:MAG: alpha/beta hydrolase [Candidatus Goldbacteria bacterium]|nr:alpha/beta hydrolase [Candidatus Goldiibacteriota bacterium]